MSAKLVWVPSHSHIFGNEQADCLAKLGATRGIIYKREQHLVIGILFHFTNGG